MRSVCLLVLLGAAATLALLAPSDRARALVAGGPAVVYESDFNGTSDIYLSQAPGSPRRILGGPTAQFHPAVSDDGRLAVASNAFGNVDVYVAELGGGTLTRVTDHPASDYQPTWSPDGGRLAFVSERSGTPDIWVAAPVRQAEARPFMSAPGRQLSPAWSPSGDVIAFSGNQAGSYDIWTVGEDGEVQQLTSGPAVDFEPAFSPDGSRIAFTRRAGRNYDLYVVRTDGSGLRRLTHVPAEDSEPAWSPDGRQIAFVSDRTGDYDVYVIAAGGGIPTNISRNRKGVDIGPTWIRAAPAARAVASVATAGQGVTCPTAGPFAGSDGADMIEGNNNDNTICGRGGNDTIRGRAGADRLSGGSGRDMLFGGQGPDKFSARDSLGDRLDGGPGIDRARADGAPPDLEVSIEAPL